MRWLCAVVVVTQCLQTALTARILALCAVACHSHSLWCYKYMSLLAERGHQITVLGVDKPKIHVSNMTTFIATGVYESVFEEWAEITESDSKVGTMYDFQFWSELSTKAVMRSQALQDLIKKYKDIEKPFDLIIHDNCNVDALLGLVPLFGNPPLLLATTYGSPQWMTSRVGNIFNPAYVPSMITPAGQHMTFYERGLNTFYYVFLEWLAKTVFEPFQDKAMREVFGNHLPYVGDITKRANVIIVNLHSALDGPRPLMPGVVDVAGLHINEPKPLPQDIKSFMDGAEHGVILFSFGSNVDSTWFVKDFERKVVEALGQLPQRVLWKWDKIPPNLPPNIKISQWLPQGDILVHPKLRLFITHCGLLSAQEAVYHKVPVLALPVFLDQIDIAAMLVRRNLTIQLNIHRLTAEELREGIKEVLSNPMYKKNMEKMGELMKDMPQTAKEKAVFWTEYVIRHEGAPHMRSAAADMPWYQLLLLDVLGLVLFSVLLTLWVIKYLISFVITSFLCPQLKTKKD